MDDGHVHPLGHEAARAASRADPHAPLDVGAVARAAATVNPEEPAARDDAGAGIGPACFRGPLRHRPARVGANCLKPLARS